MSIFVNRYPSACSNKACGQAFGIGQGYVQKTNGSYVPWCKNCVPEKIGSSKSTPVRREITEDFKIFMPYEPENILLVKSLPKAKWNPNDKFWGVSSDLADRRRILEVANLIGLDIPSGLKLPEEEKPKLEFDTSELYPFQIEGSTFCLQKSKCLLGDEMGLGKSVQALMALSKNSPAMIICRAGLKYNWLDEIKRWRPDSKPVVISGKDNFCWPENGEIIIINHDILPKEFQCPAKIKGEIKSAYMDRVKTFRKELRAINSKACEVELIIDEAHDFKTYSSQRSKKVKEICRMVKKVIGLTGSPLTNRPSDLYGVFDTLGLAGETFGTFDRFKTLFNARDEVVNRQGQTATVWGLPNPIVPELLKRVMLRRLRKDVLPDLPSKTYTNLFVDLGSRLKKQMDGLWEDWKGLMEQKGELPPFTCFSAIRKEIATSRVDAMLEYVEDAEDQQIPLVVFSAHLAPLDALLTRPGWAVISGDTPPEVRQEIVRSFQNNKLKGVGVSIRAGGVGITLTNAWKVLFVDLDWTPAANWQAEDRVARIGQKSNKVEIVRMVSNHVLDLHVHELLAQKIKVIQDSIDGNIQGKKVISNVSNVETDEQFENRINNVVEIQKQFEKNLAKTKVQEIYNREKEKSCPVVLDKKIIESIKKAFNHMLSVCDGAISEDDVGFNKPDSAIAHWVLSAGLETDEELQTAHFILNRYKRQLKTKFPALFRS